ncbi:unnamed protein product, partial [Amoebophrya sp. A25]
WPFAEESGGKKPNAQVTAEQLDEAIQQLKKWGPRVETETSNLQQMRKDRLDPSHTDDLELLSSYTSWIL